MTLVSRKDILAPYESLDVYSLLAWPVEAIALVYLDDGLMSLVMLGVDMIRVLEREVFW